MVLSDPYHDPFDGELRFCDDDGMVSHEEVVDVDPTVDRTYLDRLNRMAGNTVRARGEEYNDVPDPFRCTGHVHLMGVHLRCSSPAHDSESYVVFDPEKSTVSVMRPGFFLPGESGDIPVERLRAAIRLLSPDDMTPYAKRILEHICDEYDATDG